MSLEIAALSFLGGFVVWVVASWVAHWRLCRGLDRWRS